MEAQVHIFKEVVVDALEGPSVIFAMSIIITDSIAREHLGAEDPLVVLVPTNHPVQGLQLVPDVRIVGGLCSGAQQVPFGFVAISC